jgi:hypothetical protein
VTAYTRALPSLGFDPTPGDVDLTRNLAQQHAQVAQEARQVLALLERLDLSPLQGKTADSLRSMQATFAPALRDTAAAAETVQQAVASWADQLSGFQAEADALERQAAAATAQQQALHTQQATLPPGSTVLTADVQTAADTVTGIHSQAQELQERYLAAASKTAAAVDDNSGVRGSTEPVRKVLETVLAPLDIVAADHWVGWLKEIAGVPSELVSEFGKEVDRIAQLKAGGKSINEELIEAAKLGESTGQKYDAWYAFAPNWLKTAAGSIAEIRGLSYTLSGLGLVADAGTIIWPQNQGTLGWVDRGAAIGNAALITADLALAPLPIVGEVAMAATGLYLAGDFLYQHWTPFHDVANDVGHATVRVADDIGHGTVKAADSVGHAAGSAWHSVTSGIGSLF